MRVMTAVLVACLQVPATPGAPGALDPASWSGHWEGTAQQVPAGSCRFGGLQKPVNTRLVLEIAADGTIVAGERPLGGGIEDGKHLWRGRLERDLKVRLVAPAQAACNGRPRRYEVEYRGRFKERGGSWRLELDGRDSGCPDLDCQFTRELRLTRR